MKNFKFNECILISILIVFCLGCEIQKSATSFKPFWGAISEDSESVNLYKSNSLESTIERVIQYGSIIYFYKLNGSFYEVYTKNPVCVKDDELDKYKFFVYKPIYNKLRKKYYKNVATLYELPYNSYLNYIRGERGGCYYINLNGNRTYVNRKYCSYAKSNILDNSGINRKKISSVRCSGLTQKRVRCKNRTTNSSGRCYLH